MKVYVLINTCKNTVEGVFTYEGKLIKDKERLEAAHILRVKEVERLCEEQTKFGKVIDGLNKRIMNAFADVSPSPSSLLNDIALRDTAARKFKKLRESIKIINQLSAEEVINKYGTTYWEVRELLGD